jgi:hypothetical protein
MLQLALSAASNFHPCPGSRPRGIPVRLSGAEASNDKMVLVFAEPRDSHLRKKFTPNAKNFWAELFHTRRKAAVSANKSSGRSQIHSKKTTAGAACKACGYINEIVPADPAASLVCKRAFPGPGLGIARRAGVWRVVSVLTCYYFNSYSRPWRIG